MPAFKIEHIDSDSILYNKYGVYSKKELEAQLKEGHLTIDNLAELYRLKGYQMLHVLRVLKIAYRNALNDTRIMSPEITTEMHQILLGTLAGDAYMKHPKCYQLSHGPSQIAYLYDAANILAPFVSSISYKVEKSGAASFNLCTHRHDAFLSYFNRFYSRGSNKKYFTEATLHDLDPRGLAYWYMDDGKYGDYGAYLCVGTITLEEGEILRDLLKNRFGLETTFQNHDKMRGYHNIYIKAESRGCFFGLIKPYIIPSMVYKIEGQTPLKLQFDKTAVEVHHNELCEKAGRFINFSSASEFSIEVKQNDFKENYIKEIQNRSINKKQISHTCI